MHPMFHLCDKWTTNHIIYSRAKYNPHDFVALLCETEGGNGFHVIQFLLIVVPWHVGAPLSIRLEGIRS